MDLLSQECSHGRRKRPVTRAVCGRRCWRPRSGGAADGCSRLPHTWPWAAACPDVATEVATAVARVRETSVFDESLLLAVAERLQSSLHLPAVREALRCLIPGWLDPALDDKQRKGLRSDADRVGVKIACKG